MKIQRKEKWEVRKIELYWEKKKYRIEIFALFLYIIALAIIMYYHEPCFDEAQAWLIARDASIKEFLSSITHNEGHPPIWYLILMPFAKMGLPFEIGLKTVNFTIITLAMGIFIFRSPFNLLIRCTIPFTYFFFYQYGVISRTYSLMMLGFVLSAMFYRKRNEKPFAFVASLSLICGASAYGILIAAGISMVWLWEMVGRSFSLNKMKAFLKSKSFYSLLFLLIFNILLLLCIYPYPNTYAIKNAESRNIAWVFYMFFIAPADALCAIGILGSETQFIICILISVLINMILLKITKMVQKRALFIVPYLLFAVFAGTVYFNIHHIGIIVMFYMFLLWCCLEERFKITNRKELNLVKPLYYVGCFLVIFSIGTSIFWSVSASVKDIYLNYGTGREAAEFIISNKLDQKNILVAWHEIVNSKSGERYQDYNFMLGIPSMAYFNNNIFYNFNKKSNNKCYLLHVTDTNGYDTKEQIENKYPDILLGTDNSMFTFGTEINMDDFVLVKSIHGNTIWKSKLVENREFIYMRKDLLKDYPNLSVLNMEKEKINLEEKKIIE